MKEIRRWTALNSLPNDNFLDWSEFKELADDKINMTEKLKFELGRVENIVGKGENAGYQHFLLFLQCFQKTSNPGSLKVGILWFASYRLTLFSDNNFCSLVRI